MIVVTPADHTPAMQAVNSATTASSPVPRVHGRVARASSLATDAGSPRALPLPMHMQYAAAAESAAARQSMRSSSGRGMMADLMAASGNRHSHASHSPRDAGAAAASSNSWSAHAASPHASSTAAAYYAHAHSQLNAAHAAAQSTLPTTLHPSAAQLTPLPNFSHESLGAYQLRIDSEFSGELFSLRHNTALGVHQKTAMCLAALEKLANNCIVNHGASDGKLNAEQQNAQVIMALLAASRNKTQLGESEDHLDGIPISQHHAALRSTILNLQSMLLPLMVAPRALFQEALHKAEECGVKHGAIIYETDDPDSVVLGPDGLPVKKESSPPDDPQRRAEEAKLKEERLQQVEQLLLAHEQGIGSGDNLAGLDGQGGDEEEKTEGGEGDLDIKAPKFNYKFLFTRDDESGLDPNTVPYYEVIQNFQYMKNVLSKKLLAAESLYLESVSRLYSSGEEIAYLKELNRGKDIKCASTTRADTRLHDEFTVLREKLNDNYQELKKLRAKNLEMKKLKGQGNTTHGKSSDASGGGRGPTSSKEAKKQFEDLVMSLKERNDEIGKFSKNITNANAEKDNLVIQVEILEQAVQTMRYMVNDILKKINDSDAVSGTAGVLRSMNPKQLRGEGTIVGSGPAANLGSRNMISCRGIGARVPKFLAYSGWVRRYDLGKRHTELIIKEIWSLKTVADETRRKSGLKRTTLQDFFHRYLKSRFPHPTEESLHRRMEFTYNFVEASEKYRSDNDVNLFHKILFGQCSEERYIDQMTMMAHFKNGLAQMDIIDGVRDGFIHKMVFFAGLRQFFPVKKEENNRALIDIVLREMQTRSSSDPNSTELSIDISKLVAETSDGDESAFINCIRNQYEEEVNAFPIQVKDALLNASREVFGATTNNGHTAQRHHLRGLSSVLSSSQPGEGWLPAGQIAAILQELDPGKSKHEIEHYMRRGLGLDGYFVLNTGQLRENQKETAAVTETVGRHRVQPSSVSSRSNTPQHGMFSSAKEGLPGTPQKNVEPVRKGSFSFHSPTSGPTHPQRDSFSGPPGAPGSLMGPVSGRTTPKHDRAGSLSTYLSPGSVGGSAQTLQVHHTNTRAHSRISVGAGLTLISPLQAQAATVSSERTISPSHTPTSAGPTPSPTAGGASIVPNPPTAASGRASRESRRRSSGGVSLDGRGSRNGRRSASPHPGSNQGGAPVVVGVGGAPAPGYSYDPCHFVELEPFLERLNTLFLHRTGHYNPELDIVGLHKLIKDELERQADDERKAREIAAAKRGLGTGLQVNSANLLSWASLWANYKRHKDNTHVREDLFAQLIQGYAIAEDDPLARELVDAATGEVRRVRMPLEPEYDGSAPTYESASVTLKYTVDRRLNEVVTFYRGDATKLQIDAVVNAANPQLVAGGGICAAIFAAAGHHQLSKACAKLNGCAYGQTKCTSAFKMPARYILHSVSPVDNTDAAALASCYITILDLCRLKDIRSVALCCLATGIYGFKHVDAAEIALRTTREWLDRDEQHRTCFDRIVFSVFSEEDAAIYNTLMTVFFPCAPEAKQATSSTASTTSLAAPQSMPHPSHPSHHSLVPAPPARLEKKSSLLNLDEGVSGKREKKTISFGSGSGLLMDGLRDEKENDADDDLSAVASAASSKPTSKPSTARRRMSVRMNPTQVAALLAPIIAAPPPPPPNPFTHRPGRNLASFRYAYPSTGVKAPPKTASELFNDAPLAVFVPPPVVPQEGSRDYAAYHAQRSGEQAAEKARVAQLAAFGPDGQPTGRPRRNKGHNVSLHGLARLVKTRSKEEEDEDNSS